MIRQHKDVYSRRAVTVTEDLPCGHSRDRKVVLEVSLVEQALEARPILLPAVDFGPKRKPGLCMGYDIESMNDGWMEILRRMKKDHAAEYQAQSRWQSHLE